MAGSTAGGECRAGPVLLQREWQGLMDPPPWSKGEKADAIQSEARMILSTKTAHDCKGWIRHHITRPFDARHIERKPVRRSSCNVVVLPYPVDNLTAPTVSWSIVIQQAYPQITAKLALCPFSSEWSGTNLREKARNQRYSTSPSPAHPCVPSSLSSRERNSLKWLMKEFNSSEHLLAKSWVADKTEVEASAAELTNSQNRLNMRLLWVTPFTSPFF